MQEACFPGWPHRPTNLKKFPELPAFRYRNPNFTGMINYDGKTFRPQSNSENGATTADTLFYYRQSDELLTATYSGGGIRAGQLIGLVDDQGCIDMRYHQVTDAGQLQTGICHSVPEILEDGRIRLLEDWQWTSGDQSRGHSVLEECV
ncbi:hypothetical protein GCM10027051_07410 [Niabella terrae]